MKHRIIFLFTLCFFISVYAQPKPGDYFREYTWNMPDTMKNQAYLRVGGKLDYRKQVPFFPPGHYDEGNILIPHQVDLKNALKAELVIEVILCHDDTKGLSVGINKHAPIPVTIPGLIPEPKSDYMYHTFPVVQVPLDQISKDTYFSLQVDSVHRWRWPQNLIYGATLRVYYKVPTKSPSPVVSLNSEKMNAVRETETLQLSGSERNIKRVEYLGKYKDINYPGDGVYRQWQYTYLSGELMHHIGTGYTYPFQVEWNTSWVPDQDEPMEIAARVVYDNDLIYFTQSLTGLNLERKYSVELCEPYNQPRIWVTRKNDFASNVKITGDVNKIEEARLIWRSWSPGYMNGLYVNDYLVITREGKRYAYHEHNVLLDDKKILLPGENTIRTGKTPLYRGEMVHGMEVQWPGIMMLVRYKSD
jgi:hypothetical protein